MKSKFFVIVAIIALVGFVVTLDYGDVWAQQEAPMEGAKYIYPVEFSDSVDREAEEGQPQATDWGLNGPDPQQVIYTEPKDVAGSPFPMNTFDFGDEGEVDALANGQDAFFHKLIANKANLLVSFQTDPPYTGPVGPGDDPPNGPISVYQEDIAGLAFPKWDNEHIVNDPNTVEDLDGLELWGPYFLEDVVPDPDDADYYSLVGDPDPGVGFRVSVFHWPTGPYIDQADIYSAVAELGYTESPDLVDLDALMVKDVGTPYYWDYGDTIIFSIRKTGDGAGHFDGGEIIVKPFDGVAFWLLHGGHPWDTVFDPGLKFKLDPPTIQEVDAIEAAPCQPRQETPALTEWGLIILVGLLIASTVFIMLRRRKAAVPA